MELCHEIKKEPDTNNYNYLYLNDEADIKPKINKDLFKKSENVDGSKSFEILQRKECNEIISTEVNNLILVDEVKKENFEDSQPTLQCKLECNNLSNDNIFINKVENNYKQELNVDCLNLSDQQLTIDTIPKVIHKKFITQKMLNRKRKYNCDICQKSFIRNNELVRHKRIHTNVKPFTCEVCQKKFTQEGNLKWHEKVHTNERTFICDICQKAFKRKTELTTHKRIHIDDRPFICDICQKAFSQKSTLINHKATHSTEKLFACDVCSKLFSRKSNLNKHLSIHFKK